MVAPGVAKRGEVFLYDPGQARGSEIRKPRPCVVVSPDELNDRLRTRIIAPMTRRSHPYPFRVACRFERKAGYIILDQVRTVDRERLIRKLGQLSSPTIYRALSLLQEMFAP